MHECNAMQILKTKENKNIKKMVTKNFEMKHKDHVKKDLIGLSLLHPSTPRCNFGFGVTIHIRMMSNSNIGIKV